MSTKLTPYDPYSKFHREYLDEMVEREIFGAMLAAARHRKQASGLTQVDLARRCGKSKSGISHLLSGPSNLELHTIVEYANSLDMDFRFAFVDRHDPHLIFNGTGSHYLLQEFASENFVPQPLTARQWGGAQVQHAPPQQIPYLQDRITETDDHALEERRPIVTNSTNRLNRPVELSGQ